MSYGNWESAAIGDADGYVLRIVEEVDVGDEVRLRVVRLLHADVPLHQCDVQVGADACGGDQPRRVVDDVGCRRRINAL